MKDIWKEHKLEIILGLSIFIALLVLPNILMCTHAPWTVSIEGEHNTAWLSYLGNIFGALFSAIIAAYFAYKLMNRQIGIEANKRIKQDITKQIFNDIQNIKRELFIFTRDFSLVQINLYDIYIRNDKNINNVYEYKISDYRIQFNKIINVINSLINSDTLLVSWMRKDTGLDYSLSDICITIKKMAEQWDIFMMDTLDITKDYVSGDMVDIIINRYNMFVPTLNNLRNQIMYYERATAIRYLGNIFNELDKCYISIDEIPLLTEESIRKILNYSK